MAQPPDQDGREDRPRYSPPQWATRLGDAARAYLARVEDLELAKTHRDRLIVEACEAGGLSRRQVAHAVLLSASQVDRVLGEH